MVPRWNYIVPSWNHMVPSQTCKSTFSDLKYLRIGFSKKTISHSASEKYANIFFHPQKFKIPDFFVQGGTI